MNCPNCKMELIGIVVNGYCWTCFRSSQEATSRFILCSRCHGTRVSFRFIGKRAGSPAIARHEPCKTCFGTGSIKGIEKWKLSTV